MPREIGSASRARLLLHWLVAAVAGATGEVAEYEAGVARGSIRAGDWERGRRLALQSADAQLCCDCAALLERAGQPKVALWATVNSNCDIRAATVSCSHAPSSISLSSTRC